MPARKTPSVQPLPEMGSLVTVTIDDDGTARVFHGTLHRLRAYLTQIGQYASIPTYTRYPDEEALRGGDMGEPQTFAQVCSVTGNPMPTNGMSKHGPDHWIDYAAFNVRIDAPGVTITPITATGQTWLDANQSIDNRRRMMIDQIKALDPALAAKVDDFVEAAIDDAFDRGKEHEWQSNNGTRW